ncbi:MAG: DUF192 domain-containing protein [Pseudomonadota bacterium]
MKSLFLTMGLIGYLAIEGVSTPAANAQTAPQPTLEQEALSVRSDETVHTFTVEIADDPEEVATGMMGREALADDAGMLFDLGGVREASFWMKDVVIPLDMLFIDSGGQVVAIAENAVPGSIRRINPGVPVRGVLELRGGLARELSLEPGDVVQHDLFGTGTDTGAGPDTSIEER